MYLEKASFFSLVFKLLLNSKFLTCDLIQDATFPNKCKSHVWMSWFVAKYYSSFLHNLILRNLSGGICEELFILIYELSLKY